MAEKTAVPPGHQAMSAQNGVRYLLHELRKYFEWQMVGGATYAAYQLKHVLEQAETMEKAVTGAYQEGDITPAQAVHNYDFVRDQIMRALEQHDYSRFADITRRIKDGSFYRDANQWINTQDRKGFR